MNGWKTVTAIALAFLISLGAIFEIQPATALPDWMQAVLALVAAVWGIYGRAAVRGPIFGRSP